MKKILIIMMFVMTCIPMTQISASNVKIDSAYKLKTYDKEIRVKPALKDLQSLNNKNLFQAKITKNEHSIKKTSRPKSKSRMNRISKERRDRLFGLLLLAHGGKR